MTRKRIAIIFGVALGVMAAALVLAGVLHGLGGKAQAQAPPASFTKVSVPDLGQHSTGWCWVAAAANSFWWYAYNVSGEEGLLGGGSAPYPWESIDPNSQTAGSVCGTAGGSWYDANDLLQGYLGPPPIPGYRQVLSMIAQTTFRDVNQDGIRQAATEDNYCYSEGVEKWDYLIGLRDYVNNYGSGLVVHDIIDPARCGIGTGMLPIPQNPPAATFNTRDPCGPGGSGVPGVNQVVRTPTFTDYQIELSGGQDVLLWMESTSLETAHVVTGVGYNTVPAPGTVTISDPWTHSTCPDHDDCWPLNPLPSGLKPDHNNAPGHVVGPYDTCTVTSPAPFVINCGGTIWTVVDMIFVSPATGADIKVLTFYSDPEGPFTFDVSTYNVIDLIEDKHNNGPQDADVDVWWSMDPVADRNGDGIPDINVRWEAQIGDLCTYQGTPVACGEGDGPGTGGSGDGFPSLTGDNCQDDIDNDGDGTCDVNGCTLYPNSPDPDCGDVDDIHFQISLPVSTDAAVSRPLKLHCKPGSSPAPYTLTLYNDEWPVEMEDPDPSNNSQQLDIDVTCQVADPHYKMYDISDPDASAVNEYVLVEDQFNQAQVEVTYPMVLAAPAIKYVDGQYAGGGTAAPHLKCYRIEGMPDANATVNLTTQFGTETNIDVGAAGWLCIPADKEVIYPEYEPPQGLVPTEPHYVCYDIWPADPPPSGLDIDLETQFGFEPGSSITWEGTGALCAPALKDGVGDLTAPHLRCYAMSSPDDPPHVVNLFTQFPPEYAVDVNTPYAMCVPAEKQIVVVNEADKEVTDVEFRDPTGLPIDPPEMEILKSQDYTISVTSVEFNNGPDQPDDAEISFYANIPAGCEGQWVLDPANYADILTVDGDPAIPSSGTVTGPGMVAGLRTVDLHFQTLEYGIDEPPQSTQTFTRDFELHCSEAADVPYVFTFCNRADVKAPDTDPIPTNNLHCEDLYVTSLHNADIEILSWTAPSPQSGEVGVPFEITAEEVKHNDGPQSAFSNVTWTAQEPVGGEVSARWIPQAGDSQPSDEVLQFVVDLTAISTDLALSRNLELTCNTAGGPYTITLINDEWPINPNPPYDPWEDPDPSDNTATTNVLVNCTTGEEEVKWLQFPDESPMGLDVSAYEPYVLSDDFQCTESGMITQIDFWASWQYNELPGGDPNNVVFTLSLHSDVPAGPTYSHPGDLLWLHTFGPGECAAQLFGLGEEGWFEPPDHYIAFADTQIWLYSCLIPPADWYQQELGKIYWLDIQATPLYSALFGWKTSINHWNDDGVWSLGAEPDPLTWYELRYPPEHPLAGASIDLAFEIWGQPCTAGVDTDADTFNDDVECYLPTDSKDDCSDLPGDRDAWPLDMDMSTDIDVTGDVWYYVGRIGATGGQASDPLCPPDTPMWQQRLDIEKDCAIDVTGDVFHYVGMIGATCP